MIRQIPINGFDSNFSYFISDDKGVKIAVVDPGDVSHLIAEIEQDLLEPKMVLLTHSHFDHSGGILEFVEKYGIPVYMHENAHGKVDVGDDMTVLVKDGDIVKIGDMELKVMYTPGHIDDAVCYYVSENEASDGVPALITGDTLFVEGCGRADLNGSNIEDLYNSLQRIKLLPDGTRVYPGHDYGPQPFSTIGWEKKHNKYLNCKDLKEFKTLRAL